MLILSLVVISLAVTALITAGAFVFWKAALIFVLSYLVLNILFVGLALATCHLVRDMEKPIEAEKPICRFATVNVFGLLCAYMGLDVTVRGEEKLPVDKNFLLVSNHVSGFDPVVLMHRLRRYRLSCIAKPSIMRLPCIGRIAYGIGCLGIDRENDRNALKTIITAANYLKKGICNICIFPEGTRSRTGKMLPFHAGSFKIAQRAGAELVIASLKGTENITNNVPLRRTKVQLQILETVPAEKLKTMSTQELADYSAAIIAKSLEEVGA